MAKTKNSVHLLGSLGKDIEQKFTPNGASVGTLSVATEYSWKDKTSGDWKTDTDWHRVTLWNSEKVAPYLLKGTKVSVYGRLKTRSYDDKDGKKTYVTEVVADEVILCGQARGSSDEMDQRSYSKPEGLSADMVRRGYGKPKPTGDIDPFDGLGINDDDALPF